MGREARLVFISLLTLFMYGFFILIEKGFFLLPFPLFDAVIFIVGIRFFLWVKDRKTQLILGFFLVALILSIASKPIIWGIFSDGDTLELFLESKWPDLLQLGKFSVLTIFLSVLIRPRSWQQWLGYVALLFLLVANEIPLFHFLGFLTFTGLIVYLYASKKMIPFYYLFILKAALDFCEGLMMLYSSN